MNDLRTIIKLILKQLHNSDLSDSERYKLTQAHNEIIQIYLNQAAK